MTIPGNKKLVRQLWPGNEIIDQKPQKLTINKDIATENHNTLAFNNARTINTQLSAIMNQVPNCKGVMLIKK